MLLSGPQRSDSKFVIMGGAIFMVSKIDGCLVLVCPVEGAFWHARTNKSHLLPTRTKKIAKRMGRTPYLYCLQLTDSMGFSPEFAKFSNPLFDTQK